MGIHEKEVKNSDLLFENFKNSKSRKMEVILLRQNILQASKT